MLYKDLMNLGLSEKQAKVYVALLELGKSSVQDLAKRAKVNRATTYVIIDELMEIGLVSSYDEGKKTYLVAESPERLQSLLEQKKREIAAKESDLKKLLPKLKQKHQSTDEGPVVRFFEGKEGLVASALEIYRRTKAEKIKMFYDYDKVNRYITDEERERIRHARTSRNIKAQSIYVSENIQIDKKARKGERIRVSNKNFPCDGDISIYEDEVRIAIFSPDRPSGIIIKDPHFARTLESLFDLAWLGARDKEINENK